MSDEVDADTLLRAYAYGVFPMAESGEEDTLYWIDPDERGVLPLDQFHVPRRLARTIRGQPFDIRFDTAFGDVVTSCATSAPGREGTWINDHIKELYEELFRRGDAHSIECWRDDRLVGGLYGVSLGAAFFGESMFSAARDASKVALVYLAARLIAGGYMLLDTQFITDHLRQFGAVEISREAYRAQLAKAVATSADFYRLPPDAPPDAVLQSVSHTS